MPTLDLPCAFCQIVSGENPHHIFYEDDEFLGFLDKYPLNPGHSQFIPKEHHRWVWDMDAPSIALLFTKATRVVKALQRACNTDWVIADTGGIGVPHAHIHLVPRFEDDGHGELPDPKIYRDISEEEMRRLCDAIHLELESDLA